ncbi:MAG: 2-oxoacid:ferredoxin oxidoreductase subunit beta [Gemmataceae bacterium]|nr:2-oxoacid:ferredoxin oxidoreductase subunit beta [Gemmataceae bacterium]
MAVSTLPMVKPEDFASDQAIRWCPRCGDYSILAQAKKVLAGQGIPRENIVFVSGIGCSSRFPYYLNTYGFHSIHGRAPAVASGVKLTRPDLQVWVVTGDGDALSIGGNHTLHVLRRNLDVKVLLFNNQIYGLTKGQYSPTSPMGKKTYSTPQGSVDNPLAPLVFALGCEATFVARSIDIDTTHLTATLERASKHKGTAFVEIYQDCNVFNSDAFKYAQDRTQRDDNIVYLEHGKPLIFGKNKDKGIRVNPGTMLPEVVQLGQGVTEDDLLFHDEKSPDPSMAFLLAKMSKLHGMPEPVGVFRAVERPTYDELVNGQVATAVAAAKDTLDDLFNSGDTWVVA